MTSAWTDTRWEACEWIAHVSPLFPFACNGWAVPEPGCGVVGVFGWERPGWVEGSAATEARNGLLSAGSPLRGEALTGEE